ncbi:MAG TPA: fumarylacetoacetate hydrolase family protein [Alphaproteobacteria bacterium]|nr:fumarylacetoacetate hydrolase family protein [Alphaproteobacteria bacterium]
MKLVSYVAEGERPKARRLGVVLDGDHVGDLRAGCARHLEQEGDLQAEEIANLRIPGNGSALLSAGPAALDAAHEAAAWLADTLTSAPDARGLDDEPLFLPLADVHLFAPLAPSKVIAAGRNYMSHHEEMSSSAMPFVLPTTWLKGPSAITGPRDNIVRPHGCEKMDYETEMAFVIGKRCKNVPEDDAMDVVAGFTAASDITARDVAQRERKEGNRLFGKSFDGFCPMGPSFVTADDIADPNDLAIRTWVNGDLRQDGNTSDMIWKIPEIIAYVSQMELLPGDVVLTGTPAGVASASGDNSKQLKPGDVLESEVEGVGCMVNHIVDDPLPPSWDWGRPGKFDKQS